MNIFTAKNKGCNACLMKEQLIDVFMKERQAPCQTCQAYVVQVEYLKSELEKFRKEWRSEREEFKRAVDRLIETAGSHPLGQGAMPESIPQEMTDVEKRALGLFEDMELDEHGMKK